MPPTPWQTEILAPGTWAGAMPRIWRTLSCKRVHAVHAGMHVGEAAAIGVERQFAAGGGVALGDETAALAAPDKAEVFEPVDRQMREGVVDHQMVDVVVGDAGLGKGLGAGDAERARRGEILHLADHRRLDALAGAEDVDRLCREILGALGRCEDQRAAAIGDQAALQQPERIGDHPRVQHVVDGDRVLEGGARVLCRPFALHDRDHRQAARASGRRSSCSASTGIVNKVGGPIGP